MSRKKRKPAPALAGVNGWLLIDKPSGMTSRDVLNQVERKWRGVKFGHAGTLDPLASGLLLVAVGTACRLVEYSHRLGKSYEATIRLGATSSTDDADGEIIENQEVSPIPSADIQAALAKLTGPDILQTPPAFSAIHTGGKRAYELAREGREVTLAARPVRIDRIEIKAYHWPFLDVTVDCGAGTYIRSIARDLGELVGSGGFIQTLRRTAIGPFQVPQATGLPDILEKHELQELIQKSQQVLPGWLSRLLTDEELIEICHGRSVSLPVDWSEVIADKEVMLIDKDECLAGLANIVRVHDQWLIQPTRVFAKLGDHSIDHQS